ncbi:serendipity locus protein delta-like [Calliphora vicina]|uniref:serendipity locus protein delta-like n=1 Tax=Calliphora vicina TaxID=7373 RepID=UPI00325B250D
METVSLCFLCGNDTVKQNLEFYNIQSSVVPASQKPLHVVLQHLANCIKYKLIFQNETYICADCFKEMSDYDDLMLNLLSSQKRLTVLLQNALMEKPEEETSTLEDANEQSMDIELEFEDDEDDPSLVDAFNPNLDTKEELIEIDDDVIIEEETVYDHIEQPATDSTKGGSSNISPDSHNTKTERKRHSLECVICGVVLKSKYLLQNHMSECHNVKQFTCKICGVSRKDEEYLELHMNIHEGKTENECRYCPKRFTRPVNTLRHMRIHWDKKKFQCEKCGERFSLDNMLYNHRLRHEAEENPLICAICNQSFKSRKTYTHHLLIHQENRPRHYCHLCSKSFTERYTLKMHLKTHWGDKSSASPTSTIGSSKNSPEAKETETEESIGILVENDNYDSDNTCVICNKKYDAKNGLEHHLQDVHDVILK